MDKPIALKMIFDMKTIRKAIVLLTGEVMPDEEIDKKFFSCEPVEADMQKLMSDSEFEYIQLCAGMLSIMMGTTHTIKQHDDKPELAPEKTGRFQRRLDEAIKMQRERSEKTGNE